MSHSHRTSSKRRAGRTPCHPANLPDASKTLQPRELVVGRSVGPASATKGARSLTLRNFPDAVRKEYCVSSFRCLDLKAARILPSVTVGSFEPEPELSPAKAAVLLHDGEPLEGAAIATGADLPAVVGK